MGTNPIFSGATDSIVRSLPPSARPGAVAAGAKVEAQLDAAQALPEVGSTPSSDPSSSDRVSDLASLKLYQRQVEAGAKVIETADASVGFLLDTHA